MFRKKTVFNGGFMIFISTSSICFLESRNNYDSPLPYGINCLSVAVVKYPDKYLKKKVFLFAYILHGSSSHNPSDDVFVHAQETDRHNRNRARLSTLMPSNIFPSARLHLQKLP